MQDKWLAALMRAHQQAHFKAMDIDWCPHHHYQETASEKRDLLC